ncbi:MAG: signal recognition particle protein [Bacteroidota bacterium]|jgi:signal recognition particle subunit SRP54|nr:signal recognition particle protein [Bacteroidota bacterium]
MFEALSDRLEEALRRVRGQHRISEENVSDTLREVRRALLEADVNFQVTKDFIDTVKDKALGADVLKSLTPGQQIVKILHDELVLLMGSERADLNFARTGPTIIMVAGLQGSGKTTFSAKLALHLKSQGRQPLLVAADVYRPAAIGQLKQLAGQINVPVYSGDETQPVKIAEEALEYARKNLCNVIIIDTAGRLSIDEQMMQEVADIKARVNPTEILFVVDSMTGQDAVNTAKAFHDRLDYHGVVLTKLDGDTRGGAALSIRRVVDKPIKFASVGEKLEALEPFHPDRMASRILGMGDIVTLAEKAQEQFDEDQAAVLEQKMRKNQFTLDDFYTQLQAIKKMGPLSSVLEMIPGLGKALRGQEIDDSSFVKIEAMILSMTREERQKPAIINGSRRKRIADGSGTTVQDVNRLLKQFGEMQKMMKRLTRGGMRQFAQGLMNRKLS